MYMYVCACMCARARAHTYVCVCVFRATTVAHGSSQSRGQTGAVAADLHHSHSNDRSYPRLRPTPQFMARPDP